MGYFFVPRDWQPCISARRFFIIISDLFLVCKKQGFNMLAAIILEVMDREEADALKVFERAGFSSVLLSAHECVSNSCSPTRS